MAVPGQRERHQRDRPSGEPGPAAVHRRGCYRPLRAGQRSLTCAHQSKTLPLPASAMRSPPVNSSDSRRCAWVARRARSTSAVTALLAAVAFALASSPPAAADGCPSADTSYTGNCGPMFAVPSWTDAGGWNDPSQYSTIQLADVNGDGATSCSAAATPVSRSTGSTRRSANGARRPTPSGVPQLLTTSPCFCPRGAIPRTRTTRSTTRRSRPPTSTDSPARRSWRASGTGCASTSTRRPRAATASTAAAGSGSDRRPVPRRRRVRRTVALLHDRGRAVQAGSDRCCSRQDRLDFDGPMAGVLQWRRALGQGGTCTTSGAPSRAVLPLTCDVPSCHLTEQASALAPDGRGAPDPSECAGYGAHAGRVVGGGSRLRRALAGDSQHLRPEPPRLPFGDTRGRPLYPRLPVLGRWRLRAGQRRLRGQQPVVLRDVAGRRHRRPTGR